MKIKYFLRGLGLGIVFTAVLLTVAGGGKKVTLTDEEIMTRASLLGMVVPTETPELKETPKPSETPEPAETPVATETPELEETPAVTEAPETQEPSEMPAETEKPNESEKPQEVEYAIITIEGGMLSSDVARAMEAAGLVSSAKDFDKYLCDNEYASYIAIGTYKIQAGSSYYEIAEKITK